jgi:hypothetical protein
VKQNSTQPGKRSKWCITIRWAVVECAPCVGGGGLTRVVLLQVVDCNGIRFTAYNAGHVLGAAQFMIEIAGVHILYTGDYSREEDRHLMAAEIPPVSAALCCCVLCCYAASVPPQLSDCCTFLFVHGVICSPLRGG